MLRVILVGVIRLYQVGVSPLLHAALGPFGGCRFQPTCSGYASEAIRRHGIIRGGGLALTRLCRCHPWGPAGHDPVPEAPGAVPMSLPPGKNSNRGSSVAASPVSAVASEPAVAR